MFAHAWTEEANFDFLYYFVGEPLQRHLPSDDLSSLAATIQQKLGSKPSVVAGYGCHCCPLSLVPLPLFVASEPCLDDSCCKHRQYIIKIMVCDHFILV